MKKIRNIILVARALIATSCGEDFLEQKDLYHRSDESYYKTPEDIEEALAGAYAALPIDAGNNNPIVVAELLSDDRFGGGGSNDDGFHNTDAFGVASSDYYMDLFETTWAGILRVNLILKRFDQAEFESEDDRNQALGETYFLRAFFYFRLCQFFGPMPLRLEPDAPTKIPRAAPEEIYGQIAFDLKTAIELMPAVAFNPLDASQRARLGHATKWAAEGLMGRVFLFYTGYYGQTSIALPDGGTITSQDVIGWLDDCIENSGHGLLSDFRNNWTYANVNVNYPFAADNELVWADGAALNKETVFAIKYSIYGGWSSNLGQELSYSNQNVLYSGLRQQRHLPFGEGWGSGPVNPQLWDSFEEGDLRREGSILNLNIPNPEEGPIMDNFVWGSDNQMHETGLWSKKYLPVYDSVPGENRIASIYFIQYPSQDNMQLWNMQDDILIRFADVMLMSAELGSPNAQSYVDLIRGRAELDPVTVTLDVIKAERRHELVGEGFRYFDLLRWHDAEAAFAVATNIPVKNVGADAIYTVEYRPETGGFLPLPQSEVTLSDGQLEQTPGWD